MSTINKKSSIAEEEYNQLEEAYPIASGVSRHRVKELSCLFNIELPVLIHWDYKRRGILCDLVEVTKTIKNNERQKTYTILNKGQIKKLNEYYPVFMKVVSPQGLSRISKITNIDEDVIRAWDVQRRSLNEDMSGSSFCNPNNKRIKLEKKPEPSVERYADASNNTLTDCKIKNTVVNGIPSKSYSTSQLAKLTCNKACKKVFNSSYKHHDKLFKKYTSVFPSSTCYNSAFPVISVNMLTVIASNVVEPLRENCNQPHVNGDEDHHPVVHDRIADLDLLPNHNEIIHDERVSHEILVNHETPDHQILHHQDAMANNGLPNEELQDDEMHIEVLHEEELPNEELSDEELLDIIDNESSPNFQHSSRDSTNCENSPDEIVARINALTVAVEDHRDRQGNPQYERAEVQARPNLRRNPFAGIAVVYPILYDIPAFSQARFAANLKNRLENHIENLFNGWSLVVFVNSLLPGEDGEARLRSLSETANDVCVPLFWGNIGRCKDIPGLMIKNFSRIDKNRNFLNGFRMYDAYKLDQNALFRQFNFEKGIFNMRKYIMKLIILLMRSQLQVAGVASYYKTEFLNQKTWTDVVVRYIDCLTDTEVEATLNQTVINEISIICPRIWTTECNMGTCNNVIHFDELQLLYEVDYPLAEEHRNSVPLRLLSKQIFNLGNSFTSNNVTKVGEEFGTVNIIEDFKDRFQSFRKVLTNFFVYIIIGVRIDDPLTNAPEHLTWEMLRSTHKGYIYIGRSKKEGAGLHHFLNTSTYFGKFIARNRLNVFWLLKNFQYSKYTTSEKYEALYQLAFTYLSKRDNWGNLTLANKKREIAPLDFFTTAELAEIYTFLTNDNFNLIYNTDADVAENFDFGLFIEPVILNRAYRYFLQ